MITIATKTKRITLKLSEEESSRMFDTLVSGILNFPKAELPELPKTELPKTQETEVTAPPDERRKYTGFLHIRCPECGEVRSFCSKNGTSDISCKKCGYEGKIEEPLKQLYINCECGGRYRYFTNRTEEMFDIECLNCGAPVSVKYNAKKGIYETIK